MPPTSITELATTLDTTTDRLRSVLQRTLNRVPRKRYYVFRVSGAAAARSSELQRPRMVVAFPSPDAALAFAQRNGYGSNVQLRPVAPLDLLVRMLTDATIGAVLFIDEARDESERGFGPSLKVERARVLQYLQGAISMSDQQPPELTAQHYDAMQWGVDFADRAAFRVALAQAIEQVVDTYQPPPGSLDSGPRSIYATSMVEEWLRTHGFPHARQRRWIDVSDDPGWGGAVELCEIDGGTQRQLLIQLLIHEDANGRQYIKHVNVTA